MSGILLALLVVFQGSVLIHALAFPIDDWDAFAIWGMKAKVIATEGLVPMPSYFTDVSLSYSHLDYPLMVPFLMAEVDAVLGRVDDRMARLAMPLLYGGLACLVFNFSQRRLPTSMALAVTAIVMGASTDAAQAGSGCADVPLAAFYTASIVCLSEWEDDPRLRWCVLCGVMSAFAAFTKNEGLVLGGLDCAAALLMAILSDRRKRRLVGAGLCTTVFLSLILPWIVWSYEIPRTHENYLAHLRVSEIFNKCTAFPSSSPNSHARLYLSPTTDRYGSL